MEPPVENRAVNVGDLDDGESHFSASKSLCGLFTRLEL